MNPVIVSNDHWVAVVRNTFIHTVDAGEVKTLPRRRAKSASSRSESSYDGFSQHSLDDASSNSTSAPSGQRWWMKASQPVNLEALQSGMRGFDKGSCPKTQVHSRPASPTLPGEGSEASLPVAELDGFDEPEAAGDESQPSAGSLLHDLGTCNPCLFFFRGNCVKGPRCEYCHLVHEGQTHKRIRPSKQTRVALREQGKAKTAHSRSGRDTKGSSEVATTMTSTSTSGTSTGSTPVGSVSGGPPGCWITTQPCPQTELPHPEPQRQERKPKQSPKQLRLARTPHA